MTTTNNDTLFKNQSASDYSDVEGNTHPKIFVIINCVLNGPLMFISIIGNTLVLAAILRTPSLRSPSMILLCSLAVPDLLVGFVVQPLFLAKELLEEDLFLLRACYFFFTYSLCGISFCTVTAISLDRFAALHYHMKYVAIVTLVLFAHKEWPKEWNFAITIMFMNSSINPFLFCWRLRELRTAVVTLARKLIF
ncbi:D(2)-like dopamine receptor [Oculina patagonica]